MDVIIINPICTNMMEKTSTTTTHAMMKFVQEKT
jgi:hypothetical protein